MGCTAVASIAATESLRSGGGMGLLLVDRAGNDTHSALDVR